ncbi:hypothetical protein I7I51_05397 [Histoplasma capsulatum]|uniref:Uncharacterized protein n=1 Tax=Ajellomyces capsulatus TaxID=5037 RepID=A0A8A1M295_AJECA|nr:hypothetical protein I7I51_05397 [Histoplasma capsulatum]
MSCLKIHLKNLRAELKSKAGQDDGELHRGPGWVDAHPLVGLGWKVTKMGAGQYSISSSGLVANLQVLRVDPKVGKDLGLGLIPKSTSGGFKEGWWNVNDFMSMVGSLWDIKPSSLTKIRGTNY